MSRFQTNLFAFSLLFSVAGRAAAGDPPASPVAAEAQDPAFVAAGQQPTEALPPAPPPPPAASTPSWSRPAWGSPAYAWPQQQPPPESEPKLESNWYGWQTLIVDGVWLFGLSAADEQSATLIVGTYVLGGPIVHWSHGNVGRGFGSLALRLGAPLGLALAFASGCDSSDGDMGCIGSVVAGAALGVVGAVVLDASVLAREEVPIEDSALSIGPVQLAPAVSMDGKAGMMTASGVF